MIIAQHILIAIIILTIIVIVIGCFWGKRLPDEDFPERKELDIYYRTRAEHLQAEQNFNQADPQYIDIAISDLGASRNKLNNEIKKIRLEGGESIDTKAISTNLRQPGATNPMRKIESQRNGLPASVEPDAKK